MTGHTDRTEYILLPLSIYKKFFKDVKISGRKISAVLDEAEIRRNKRKQDSQPTNESKKSRLSKTEPRNTVAHSDSESGSSDSFSGSSTSE